MSRGLVHPHHGLPVPARWSFAEAYRALGSRQKPGAGVPFYTRAVNRRLGRVTAAAAAALRLTPDALTSAGALLWVAALTLLASARTSPGVVSLAVALLAVSFALDSADGQLARLTGRSGPAGEWLDHVLDAARIVALHLAVAVALYRFSALRPAALLVPLGFCLVASTRFVAQLLAEQLRDRVLVTPTSGASGTHSLAALVQLPADTGLLNASLLLLPRAAVFLWVYGALAIAHVALLAATIRRRRRELRRLGAHEPTTSSGSTAPADLPAAARRPGWPSVSVVIATVERPELLRRAVRSALCQHYDGEVEVIVVHDRSAPREVGVEVPTGRRLRVVANRRTAGLAGARNTGILAAAGELVAFCDDDDAWRPSKLREQVQLWRRHPDASAVATGITIRTDDGDSDCVPPERTDFTDLLRSRVLGLHPSALLIRRSDLTGPVGLVDEELPHSYGEDYDLLLRLARGGDVRAVQQPLVVVDWARRSHFDGHWDAVSGGLSHLLAKVPQFGRCRQGWARIAGQIAFAHAAAGRRGAAWSWAARALSRDPLQLRAYAAGAVALGLVRPAWLLHQVQRRGRGL